MAGTLETLLHFDGTNGSTTFVDATGKHTWTSDGGAAHDTSQSKFGTSSAQIGQGGAWGRILGDGTINFGSTPTPFTIDFWLKLNGTQPGQINIFDLTNTSILLYIPSPGAPINFYASGVAIAGVTNCTINVWHHVALTFDGTTQYLFLDGHLEGTWVNASIYGVASALFPLFGQGGGYSPVGWVDEARILLGGCDWTASFTPPTGPYAGGIISGTLATTEAKDAVALAGTVSAPAISGTLATTEAKDVAAFAGTNGVAGTWATVEAKDAVAFAGTVALPAVTGSLVVTEAIDVAAFAGPGAIISGTLATTEAKDTLAFVGNYGVSGTLATTEAQDVAAFAGPGAIVSGTFSILEAKDIASFVGSGVTAVTGTLAVTEATDIAAFAGSSVAPVFSGTLAVTEAQDLAAFTGANGVAGTLAVTEAKDVAAFAGSVSAPVSVSGILAAIEATDIVVFAGTSVGLPSGILATTEAADLAAFAGLVARPPDTLQQPGILNFGIKCNDWTQILRRR